MSRDKKINLSTIIGFTIGGAIAYIGGKKLLDMYIDLDSAKSIDEDEYIDELRRHKKKYIDINTGILKAFEDFEYLIEDVFIQDRADELFIEFLEKAKTFVELPDMEFTLRDIYKIINTDKYEAKYFMKFLSEDKGFVIFKLEDIGIAFNNLDRLDFLDRYKEDKFIINPKYIKLVERG